MPRMKTSPSKGVRYGQKEYLEKHKTEVLADLFAETPYESIAQKHRVTSKYLRESVALWTDRPEFKWIDPIPKPPELLVGLRYTFKDGRRMRYIGTHPGKCVTGVFYMFWNCAGAKESFTIYQLVESLRRGDERNEME